MYFKVLFSPHDQYQFKVVKNTKLISNFLLNTARLIIITDGNLLLLTTKQCYHYYTYLSLVYMHNTEL